MMGHDAPYVFIHVVKTTHDDNRLYKQTGYLAVTFFMNDDHDLIELRKVIVCFSGRVAILW